jgi:hypothetical protein
MDIHGIVITIKTKVGGMMGRVWSAMTSVWKWLWNNITAFGTHLMTRTVTFIKHVVIQSSIELYHAASRTLLAWLIKLGIIIVNPIHTVLGILHQKTVALHQQLVSKLQKVEE